MKGVASHGLNVVFVRIRIRKVGSIFLTKLDWEHIGGLPGAPLIYSFDDMVILPRRDDADNVRLKRRPNFHHRPSFSGFEPS